MDLPEAPAQGAMVSSPTAPMPDALPSSSPAHSTLRPDQGELHDVRRSMPRCSRATRARRTDLNQINLWLVALTGGAAVLGRLIWEVWGQRYSGIPTVPPRRWRPRDSPSRSWPGWEPTSNNCVPCHPVCSGTVSPTGGLRLGQRGWERAHHPDRAERTFRTRHGEWGRVQQRDEPVRDLFERQRVAAVLTSGIPGKQEVDRSRTGRSEGHPRGGGRARVAWTADELLKIPTRGGAAPAAAPQRKGVDQLEGVLKALPPDQMKSVPGCGEAEVSSGSGRGSGRFRFCFAFCARCSFLPRALLAGLFLGGTGGPWAR